MVDLQSIGTNNELHSIQVTIVRTNGSTTLFLGSIKTNYHISYSILKHYKKALTIARLIVGDPLLMLVLFKFHQYLTFRFMVPVMVLEQLRNVLACPTFLVPSQQNQVQNLRVLQPREKVDWAGFEPATSRLRSEHCYR